MARATSSKTNKTLEKYNSPLPASGKLKSFVPYYLIAYNVLSGLGWAYVLLLTIVHLSNLDGKQSSFVPESVRTAGSTLSWLLTSIPFLGKSQTLTATSTLESKIPLFLRPLYRRATTTYSRVGGPVTVVQSFAVLEVAHVLLRLVKSALLTTVMQVSSRIFLVWGILSFFPTVGSEPFFASMVFAWSSTEVIRYFFYASNLLGKEFPILTYLRYTGFYILYPMGALSEASLIYATLPTGPFWKYRDIMTMVRFLCVCIWVPGLAAMMMHMQVQRNKILRGPGFFARRSLNKGSKAN